MSKIYFIVGLMLVTFYNISASECVVEEIKNCEQARKIAPLYATYHQREQLPEEVFLQRWERASIHPTYHMFGAYEKETLQPLGFLDLAIFPAIYTPGNRMRIDSVFIVEEEKEQEIFNQLFEKALEQAKKDNVSHIICDSGDVYTQEKRLFSRKMETKEENTLFAYIVK